MTGWLGLRVCVATALIVGVEEVAAQLDPTRPVGEATVVSPGLCVAVAALTLSGFSLWPALLLASLWLGWREGLAPPTLLAETVGFAGGALLSAWLLRRWRVEPTLTHPAEPILLTAALAMGCLLAATADQLALLAQLDFAAESPEQHQVVLRERFWSGFESRLFGGLLMATLLLTWGSRPLPDTLWRRRKEMLTLAVLLALCMPILVVIQAAGLDESALEALLMAPVLLWTAMRFGPQGSATAMAVWFWCAWIGQATLAEPRTDAVSQLHALHRTAMSLVAMGVLTLAATGSQQRLALQTLAERDDHFQQVTQLLHTGWWVLDLQEPWRLTVNPAFESIWGRVGTAWFREPSDLLATLHPKDSERASRMLAAGIRGEPTVQECRVIRPDGSVRWIECHVLPIRDGLGRVVRVTGLCNDFTDRLALDEQRRHSAKMDAIGKLADGIAHDFNSLLMAVIIHADIIKRQLPVGHPARLDAEQIATAADRAARLTQQLSAMSRQRRHEPTRLDLVEFVRSAVGSFQRLLGGRPKLELELPTPGLGNCEVVADPTGLNQVLLSLVVRAQSATDGDSCVWLSVEPETGPTTGPTTGPMVTLSVTDEAPPLSDAQRLAMFEPFAPGRAPGALAGMELATVLDIIEQNSGRVSVRSPVARGRGSEFRILLPAAPAASASAASAPAVSAPLKPTVLSPAPHEPTPVSSEPRHETVLLVGADEGSPLRQLSERLCAEGYLVLESVGGRELLELEETLAGPIHVLVADLVGEATTASPPRWLQEFQLRRPKVRTLIVARPTPTEAELAKSVYHLVEEARADSNWRRMIRRTLLSGGTPL